MMLMSSHALNNYKNSKMLYKYFLKFILGFERKFEIINNINKTMQVTEINNRVLVGTDKRKEWQEKIKWKISFAD